MPDHPPRSVATEYPSSDEPGVGGDSPPATPEHPPGYELLDPIGRGGMGVVYRARDLSLGRDVAVKLLRDDIPAGSSAARRFLGEAKVTARLQHPGIPPVHLVGTLPSGRPFLAMKLIEGRTLAAILAGGVGPDKGGSPNLVAAFERVCEAVGFAHSQGVIHRDLKPGNVMVGAFGEVQVMDWGLARLTGDRGHESGVGGDSGRSTPSQRLVSADTARGATTTGSVLGTPAFMAPEQARGERAEARADVFALGGILCAILTGRPPFDAPDGPSTLALAAVGGVSAAFARLDRCGADPDLVGLCKRCLSPEADDRPADGKAVADALAGLRAAAEQRTRQAELDREKARVWAAERRKRRRVQAALGLAVLTLLALVALGLWNVERTAAARRAEQARVEADRQAERAAVVAGAREAVDAGVRLAADLRDQFRFAEAATALDQAAAQVPDDAPADLRDRLAEARADLALVRDLDDIRFGRIRGGDPLAGAAVMPAKYRAAFQSRGLDPAGPDTAAAAARVAASKVRRQIVVALDDWAYYGSDPAERERLLAVLRAVDPHPFGDRLRDPATRGSRAALDRLAAETDLTAVPPDLFVLYMQMPGGPWPQAREQIGAVALRNRDHFWVQTEAAYYYTMTDPRPADAAAYLRAALAVRPDNRYALIFLGSQLRALGDLDGAAAAFREAIRLDPNPADGHFNLGVVLKGKGDAAGAAAAFRASLARDPKDADAHILLAQCLQATGPTDGVVAALRAAAELRPGDARLHFNLGTLLDRTRDLPGAAAAYRRAAGCDPKLVPAWYNLGGVLADLRKFDEAADAYREVIKLDPRSFDAHHNLCNVLRAKGDLAGAVAAGRKAVAIAPDRAAGHNSLGRALFLADELDEAIFVLREAVRLDPKSARAHSNLGDALAARDDLDEAATAYRDGLRIEPNFPLAKDGLARVEARIAKRDGTIAPPPREVKRE